MRDSEAGSGPPKAPEDEERPRVLGVRFGVNPNSSSLAVDVTYLLFGGTAALAASLFLSALLRARRRKVEAVGLSVEPATAEAPVPKERAS